jgi:hypothetical protein
MRSLFGVLLVPALAFGLGACADETDPIGPTPRPPTEPDHVIADEPLTSDLARNERELLRPPSADIGQDVTIGNAFDLGRLARSRLDRLRAAGLVH